MPSTLNNAKPAVKPPVSIDDYVKSLVDAEGLARGEARRYLIDYRVAEKDIIGKGPPSKRRGDLIKIIKALTGSEWHLATSAWTIISKRDPDLILKALSRPLHEDHDFVALTQVAHKTRRFGNAKLES